MAEQKQLCPCGYSWEGPICDPVPPDIREICPACTAGIRAASTPAGRTPDGSLPGTDSGRRELKPGDELAGFEVLRPLNRGGMGVVYKARQISLNRLVALKVIAPEWLGDANYLKRFGREVRAAAMLNHPNIVTVYATDLSGPWPYLAMEYVDGIDLNRLVQHSGPLGFLDSAAYIRQTALGLQHAFERGLVHRDIKPHNLMLTPSPFAPATGRPPVIKILDMGLARVVAIDEGLEAGLTCAGEFVGTPDYAAPEQAEDAGTADIRADLYSLGVTWFYLLTAQVPFPGVSLMQKLRRLLTQPTPLVTDHCPDIPAGLAGLVRKLMDRDPGRRFQTPAELVEAINAYQRDPSRAMAFAIAPASLPTVDEPVSVKAHTGGVAALCLNGDGRLLLTGGNDEELCVWEAPELKQIRSVSGNPGPVCSVAMTSSGKWGVSCALRLMPRDIAVQLWDLGAGVERRRLAGSRKNLTCVALTADGRKVAAGCEDGTVRLWTLDPPDTSALTLAGHADAVTGVAFAPDGGVVLSVARDGTLRQWDVKTGREKGRIRSEAGALKAVACDWASSRVALAGDRLQLRQPDRALITLEGHREGTLCVAFSADGTLLASGGRDPTLRLWRPSDGQLLTCLTGHDGPVCAVAFSPDRQFLYSGGADGMLRRWAIGPAAMPVVS